MFHIFVCVLGSHYQTDPYMR